MRLLSQPVSSPTSIFYDVEDGVGCFMVRLNPSKSFLEFKVKIRIEGFSAVWDLDFLRVCALLHDIGKVECWAREKPWSEHIYYTYKFVRDLLGEECAETSMRHHTGFSYSEEVFPRSEVERIVWFADNLASGADRREEPVGGSPKPGFPLVLSHVLSKGDAARKEFDQPSLAYISAMLKEILKEPCSEFSSNSTLAYNRIFHVLGESDLLFVPADTRYPVNDVSLWDHMKLTAAISTCIFLDGGFKDSKLEDYRFAFVSGDADRISSFINVSVRIRDLHARSELINEATRKAYDAVSEVLGPECVLYSGGGSFLVISPTSKASVVESSAKRAFEKSTDGLVTMTTSIVEADGREVRSHFGDIWHRAQETMRIRKSERGMPDLAPVDEGMDFCDVCHSKPAVFADESKILRVDASARPERLCRDCWKLRQSGSELHIKLDELGEKTGFVGLLKADGDDVGKLLSGEKFPKLNKANTPSRLSTLSRLINKVCREELEEAVRKFGGECVYSGGDDLMALLPGETALLAARTVCQRFRRAMNFECTMSVGLAIFRKELPLYMSLEVASSLLSRAKDAGKDRIAFMFLGSSGVTSTDVSRIKPLIWDDLDALMSIVGFMRRSDISVNHYRRAAMLLTKSPERAEAYIKYLMGREIISWDEGEKLLEYIRSGLLRQAFTVYNLLERRKK